MIRERGLTPIDYPGGLRSGLVDLWVNPITNPDWSGLDRNRTAMKAHNQIFTFQLNVLSRVNGPPFAIRRSANPFELRQSISCPSHRRGATVGRNANHFPTR